MTEEDNNKKGEHYNVDPNNPYSDKSADVGSEGQQQTDVQMGEKAHESAPDVWPLEADRVAVHDPLVNCLQLLAGHYGRRASVASLVSGLPIPKGGITPVLFERAAARADMNSIMVERTLDSLAIAPNLPCIMVLDGGQSCILWEVRQPKQKASKSKDKKIHVHPDARFVVQFPETQDERQEISIKNSRKSTQTMCSISVLWRGSMTVRDQLKLIMRVTGSGLLCGIIKIFMPKLLLRQL